MAEQVEVVDIKAYNQEESPARTDEQLPAISEVTDMSCKKNTETQ